MMHRLALLLAGVIAAGAQETTDLFSKAPPAVDAALRERMTQFYTFHVTEKFRQAEQLVAEDTKDFFYSSNKPRYLSFEIVRIEYSNDFTRAKGTVLCEQYVMIPGFTDKPLKVPTPSRWKLEPDGKWYWYVDMNELRKTPFGIAKPGPARQGGVPSIPGPSQMAFIFSQVKVEPPALVLKPGESSRVTLTNGAKGSVDVSILTNNLGVEAKLEGRQLKSGESTTLVVRRLDGAKEGSLRLQVDPTNQIISIPVNFPELAARTEAKETPDTGATAGQVKAFPAQVALDRSRPSRVQVTNGSKDAVTVSILFNNPGVEAQLEKERLKPGETTALVLRNSRGAHSGTIQLRVEPTNQVVSIPVTLPEPEPEPEPARRAAVAPEAPAVAAKAAAAVQVSADPATVILEGSQPARVKLTNGVKGEVRLSVRKNKLGMKTKIEKGRLKAGESTALVLRKSSKAKAGTIEVQVKPTGQILSIPVTLQ